jgi:peptidyl-prolyl cis-trans isomerase SurA
MLSRFHFDPAVRSFVAVAVMCLGARAQTVAPVGSVEQAVAAPLPASSAAMPAPAPAAPKMPVIEGQEIDRVVAIVNEDLILDSDVDEERRFTELQPFRDRNKDLSRDDAIERLINRDLILQQIKLRPEDPITDADVKKDLDALRNSIPECKNLCQTEAGWVSYLAAHGFTLKTLTERWRERMEVLRFIEERFRMGTHISPAEIRDFYEKTMLPQYAHRHATPPKLDTISDRIQEVLLQQQVSNLLGDWLKSLHAQGSVVVLKQGEVAP